MGAAEELELGRVESGSAGGCDNMVACTTIGAFLGPTPKHGHD